KLNKEDGGKRKFILVEMANYFDTVIIPRIKKVAYSFNWKNGEPQDTDGIGIFFKYYDLEQYEQTLKKAVYKESHPFVNFDDRSIYQQYVFMKDVKLLDAIKLDYESNKIRMNFDEIYQNIDLAETLSNLTGKWIKKIEKDAVIFEDDSRINFDDINFNLIKPLIWW
ncbi:MAG: site-specific DNA-methyltransferase, partial [Promethearchaeota archaeon]